MGVKSIEIVIAVKTETKLLQKIGMLDNIKSNSRSLLGKDIFETNIVIMPKTNAITPYIETYKKSHLLVKLLKKFFNLVIV